MMWRMAKMCNECPFDSKGAGLHLRKSLRRGCWREILTDLDRDGQFPCHKTTAETGDGSELMCAGAIEYQEANNGPGQLQRIMERLDYFRGKRA